MRVNLFFHCPTEIEFGIALMKLAFWQELKAILAITKVGTLLLSAGIPIESISKMMGHTNISSTQVYSRVTNDKISEDMDKLIKR